jgi:uncharacterized membrane protein
MTGAETLGRLHPLLVHLPIGILLLAALFECLSWFRPYRKLRRGVRAMVFWGALASTLSVVTGWILADQGGYDDRLIYLHKNAGIVTTVFAWIIFFARDSIITLFQKKKKRKLIRIFMFLPLAALVALTGHLGGSLTHGEDYLFAGSVKVVPVTLALTGDPDSAYLYQDVIAPILRTRCYSCHGTTKQKGELRLDDPSHIAQGGKHGPVIDALPDSGTLYERLMLPLEDEHHMPPSEKPQPSSAEIALIHAWLAEGAPFDKRIGQLQAGPAIKDFLTAFIRQGKRQTIIPDVAVAPAPVAAIEALKNKGLLIIPLGDSTNYLSVSYVNARSATDDDLALLLPVREQLLWLNLGRTTIGDNGMEIVGKLDGLTQLNLEYTLTGDEGVGELARLPRLQSLNLVGTAVTDAGVRQLSSMKSLRKMYCFGTPVTANGVLDLSRLLPELLIDTGGYKLPPRVTDTLDFARPKR